MTVTGARAATERMDIHAVACQFNRSCRSAGPSPTARHRNLPTPGRLQLAHRAWTHTEGAEGEYVARSWFIGANPVLHEATPMTAIRSDRGEDLMLAVKILL